MGIWCSRWHFDLGRFGYRFLSSAELQRWRLVYRNNTVGVCMHGTKNISSAKLNKALASRFHIRALWRDGHQMYFLSTKRPDRTAKHMKFRGFSQLKSGSSRRFESILFFHRKIQRHTVNSGSLAVRANGYAIFATIVVLAISRWNPRGFGTRLGIAGKETAR